MSSAPPICVIGAGSTGLCAVKTCLDHGLDVICYECRPRIGGLYTGADPAFSALAPDGRPLSVVHDATTLVTSKHVATFSDFPLPRDMAEKLDGRRYMSGLEFAEYLERYAAAFGVTDHVQLNTEVVEVRRSGGNDCRAAWEVTVRSGRSSVTKTTRHRHVIIASGAFRKPNFPTLPGMQETPVHVIHSLNCRDTKKLFSGQRVLVLGGSTSAGDMVQVALSCGAEQVTWALHRASHRAVFLLPRHAAPHRRLAWDECLSHFESLYLPRLLHARLQRMAVCAFAPQPASPPRLRACDRLAVQDVDLLRCAQSSGRLLILPATLARFSAAQPAAELTDGRSVAADVAVLAFGGQPSFPFLGAEVLGDAGLGALSLFRHCVPTAPAAWGLSFLYAASWSRADLLATEMEARWLVGEVAAGRLSTEADRRRLMERRAEAATPFAEGAERREAFPVVLRLAREVGCQPALWPAVLSPDPWARRVALAAALGPWIPAQYRLRGPHARPETAARTVVGVAREVMGWRFEAAAAVVDAVHLVGLAAAGLFLYRRFW